METDKQQDAQVIGNGSSVNLNLGSGFREAGWLISGLIVALVLSSTLALVAYLEAKEASYQASRYALWSERLEANLLAHGVQVPPFPEDKRK